MVRPEAEPLSKPAGVVDEHRRLAHLLDRVEAARASADLRVALADLRVTLERHFAWEEANEGLYPWLASVAPHAGGAIGELLVEHRDMLREVEGLMAGAAAPGNDAVVEGARSLVARLRGHERREAESINAVLRSG